MTGCQSRARRFHRASCFREKEAHGYAKKQYATAALPLYEGRMIGQSDFSQKGWVSGKGRSAVWRDIPWERKQIEPQFPDGAQGLCTWIGNRAGIEARLHGHYIIHERPHRDCVARRRFAMRQQGAHPRTVVARRFANNRIEHHRQRHRVRLDNPTASVRNHSQLVHHRVHCLYRPLAPVVGGCWP